MHISKANKHIIHQIIANQYRITKLLYSWHNFNKWSVSAISATSSRFRAHCNDITATIIKNGIKNHNHDRNLKSFNQESRQNHKFKTFLRVDNLYLKDCNCKRMYLIGHSTRGHVWCSNGDIADCTRSRKGANCPTSLLTKGHKLWSNILQTRETLHHR